MPLRSMSSVPERVERDPGGRSAVPRGWRGRGPEPDRCNTCSTRPPLAGRLPRPPRYRGRRVGDLRDLREVSLRPGDPRSHLTRAAGPIGFPARPVVIPTNCYPRCGELNKPQAIFQGRSRAAALREQRRESNARAAVRARPAGSRTSSRRHRHFRPLPRSKGGFYPRMDGRVIGGGARGTRFLLFLRFVPLLPPSCLPFSPVVFRCGGRRANVHVDRRRYDDVWRESWRPGAHAGSPQPLAPARPLAAGRAARRLAGSVRRVREARLRKRFPVRCRASRTGGVKELGGLSSAPRCPALGRAHVAPMAPRARERRWSLFRGLRARVSSRSGRAKG